MRRLFLLLLTTVTCSVAPTLTAAEGTDSPGYHAAYKKVTNGGTCVLFVGVTPPSGFEAYTCDPIPGFPTGLYLCYKEKGTPTFTLWSPSPIPTMTVSQPVTCANGVCQRVIR